MKRLILLVFSAVILFSCNESDSNGTETKELDPNDISSIIRNPVSAVEEVDVDFVPKMTFEETTFDFGSVKAGDIVEHTFKFKNTGQVPLLIAEAKTTCSCTVPSFPKEYVRPGKSGEIKVIFDTKNYIGHQAKPITIVSNTYPRDTKLIVQGNVEGIGGDSHNH